jgi:hypothetical protein
MRWEQARANRGTSRHHRRETGWSQEGIGGRAWYPSGRDSRPTLIALRRDTHTSPGAGQPPHLDCMALRHTQALDLFPRLDQTTAPLRLCLAANHAPRPAGYTVGCGRHRAESVSFEGDQGLLGTMGRQRTLCSAGRVRPDRMVLAGRPGAVRCGASKVLNTASYQEILPSVPEAPSGSKNAALLGLGGGSGCQPCPHPSDTRVWTRPAEGHRDCPLPPPPCSMPERRQP